MRPPHPDTPGVHTTVPNEDGSLSVFDAAANHRMRFEPNDSFRYDAPAADYSGTEGFTYSSMGEQPPGEPPPC